MYLGRIGEGRLDNRGIMSNFGVLINCIECIEPEMKDLLWKYLGAVLAGMAIGIAAICYLKGGLLIGAALFASGLSAMVYSKWPLYTGMAGFFMTRKDFMTLWPVLLANIFGTFLGIQLGADMNLQEAAMPLVEIRLQRGFWGCLLPAIGCGFLMTVSVKYARQGKWIPLILGIPTFVICGFPHCVADIAYYTLCPGGWKMVMAWLGTVAGNWIGCNLPNLDRFRKVQTIQ